ncbi:NfeD family protein [Clostridium sp. DJ247]|uniref:NfeD family protein n=1 Tax=Clostridium sp. DJ247 TaxID=2726188 RepID=UPI0016252AA3|nr:NfeD family protein [Clostridium sp. DJ247]MBC2579475.1 NfeD family protein [Clostridium sp. DJ247]
MSSSLILWLIIGVIALVVDIITSSFLFVWFTVGAIGAIVAEILGMSFVVQTVSFIGISAICMALGYPIVKKTIKKSVNPIPTREKTYIGKEFTITEEILETNSIKVDGVYWKLINEGPMIQKGDKIRIINIKGNKIIIKKV